MYGFLLSKDLEAALDKTVEKFENTSAEILFKEARNTFDSLSPFEQQSILENSPLSSE